MCLLWTKIGQVPFCTLYQQIPTTVTVCDEWAQDITPGTDTKPG